MPPLVMPSSYKPIPGFIVDDTFIKKIQSKISLTLEYAAMFRDIGTRSSRIFHEETEKKLIDQFVFCKLFGADIRSRLKDMDMDEGLYYNIEESFDDYVESLSFIIGSHVSRYLPHTTSINVTTDDFTAKRYLSISSLGSVLHSIKSLDYLCLQDIFLILSSTYILSTELPDFKELDKRTQNRLTNATFFRLSVIEPLPDIFNVYHRDRTNLGKYIVSIIQQHDKLWKDLPTDKYCEKFTHLLKYLLLWSWMLHHTNNKFNI